MDHKIYQRHDLMIVAYVHMYTVSSEQFCDQENADFTNPTLIIQDNQCWFDVCDAGPTSNQHRATSVVCRKMHMYQRRAWLPC